MGQNGTGRNEVIQTMNNTSKIDLAVESIVDLINEIGNFAQMTFGALGTGNSLCCQLAPSNDQEVFLDKNSYAVLTLAINGKHKNQQTLTNTLNNILDNLARRTEYPSGQGWEVVDVSRGNFPRIIDREESNLWVMSCDLIIKVYRKDD